MPTIRVTLEVTDQQFASLAEQAARQHAPDTNSMGRILTEQRLRAAARALIERTEGDAPADDVIDELFHELELGPLR